MTTQKSFTTLKHLATKILREQCMALVGKKFKYNYTSDTSDMAGMSGMSGMAGMSGMSGTFEIEKELLNMLVYQNPIDFDDDLWYNVACIYWGQGCHSNLYFNGVSRLIALNERLEKTSKIQEEYAVDNNDVFKYATYIDKWTGLSEEEANCAINALTTSSE